MSERKHTDQEISEMFEEYAKTKDKKLRDKLVEEHLYLAEILAKKYVGKGIDYDDLYQVASLGVLLAVERFDPSRGYRFSSYVTPTVIGEIKRYFRDRGWVIRVPRRIQELSKRVTLAKNHLTQDLGRSPSVSELAEFMQIPQEEILEAMEAQQVYQPQSLDMTYESGREEKDPSLADFLGQEDEAFVEIELIDIIKRAMKDFDDMEKKILVERYFMERTQVSISRELKISQMTVSRIEKKIIKKFQDELNLVSSRNTKTNEIS